MYGLIRARQTSTIARARISRPSVIVASGTGGGGGGGGGVAVGSIRNARRDSSTPSKYFPSPAMRPRSLTADAV
jgi:hypothetical protein